MSVKELAHIASETEKAIVRESGILNSINIGTKIESEHKGTYASLQHYVKRHGKLPPKNQFYASIAQEHIKEFPNYYPKLIKLEHCLKTKQKRCII